MNIYLELTREFNANGTCAILSSGQAVVMHGLAIMSKDGDWILREEPKAMDRVLEVLEKRRAHYRFGAPLDLKWMRGGWSAHFEFRHQNLRVRTDFVTRPPRLSAARLEALWRQRSSDPIAFVGAADLAELKKTNREKDYAVIGELARLIEDPSGQILLSRSARDLIELSERHPDLVASLSPRRPALAAASKGREQLEAALDEERRRLMRANEERLKSYMDAAAPWAALWPEVEQEISGMPLREGHEYILSRAEGILPPRVEGDHGRDAG